MSASTQCPHLEFEAQVNVARFENSTLKYADVTIICKNCGHPAVFRGLPVGVLPDQPTGSVGGQEARLPFTVDTDAEPDASPGFVINITTDPTP